MQTLIVLSYACLGISLLRSDGFFLLSGLMIPPMNWETSNSTISTFLDVERQCGRIQAFLFLPFNSFHQSGFGSTKEKKSQNRNQWNQNATLY